MEPNEIPIFTRETIQRALEEDIGNSDVTSSLIIPGDLTVSAHIIAKSRCVVAGMPFVIEVFRLLDPSVDVDPLKDEGSTAERGDVLARVRGRATSILACERTALNILQHVSGIATRTREFVEKVKDLPARIVDTRKTLPGLRFMEKYGVRMGGGFNHRFALYDGILIKNNHIDIAGGVGRAVRAARSAHHLLKIEVEVRDLTEFEEALAEGADVIMLDNMTVDLMREAVARAWGRVVLEASGNVTLDNVRAIAETGVDLISVGSITHSAPAADISLRILKEGLYV